MKQKRSRPCLKKQKTLRYEIRQPRGENTICPKAPSENGSKEKKERLPRGSHPSGSNSNRARRRPKAAVVVGVDPRRGRVIGGYLRVQGVLPRRWVVDLAVGEHHVDGDLISGGRWFGRGWNSPVGAANSKLGRGSERWMH